MTTCIDKSILVDIINYVNREYNPNYILNDIKHITIYKTFILAIIDKVSYYINY